jgi:Na+/melibiose symporter-like transporter
MVLSSCAVGGLLVETAQEWGASGRLAATRQGIEAVSFVLAGLISGYLATLAFGITAGVCALLAFSLIPVALWVVKEPYRPPQPLGAVKGQLKTIFRARTMWGAAGLMLLFYAAPGTQTVLFYRQQNVLHASTEIQGLLVSTQYAASIATAIVYTFLCRRANLRQLLLLGIGGAALTAIFYLFYSSLPMAFVIDGLNGVGYTLAELSFLDLCARATPAGSESLGYSLMLSVRNFALFGADIVGSKLMDSYGVSFSALVTFNSVTTAIALPFVFLLPAALVARRDAKTLTMQSGTFDEIVPRAPEATHT